MDIKLAEINEIIDVCNTLVQRIEKTGTVQTGDDLYEKYKVLINSFCDKYEIGKNQSELIKTTYLTIKEYFWKKNYSVNLSEANTILLSVKYLKSLLYPDLYEKIFISHREKDKEQVDALMELLYAIGIQRPLQNGEKSIFCTSHPAAYVENGQKFDEQIFKQFYSKENVFFILWYTDNYFASQPCLNEMGAVWAMNKKYQEILIPGFDRDKIGGLLPKAAISFYADDKYRLNTLKEQIEKMFYLQPITPNAWEKARDKFIEAIEMLTKQKTEKNN